jgi:iron(III) transport system permease protein
MLLSTLVAWIVNRSQVRGRSILDLLSFVNLAIPTVVFGLAVLFVYLSVPFLRPVYGTIWILALAFTARYLTYSTRLMGSAVIQLHKELEEAAQAAGASRLKTFRMIVLPLMLPSFLNGWIWVVIHCLREATIAVMLMSPANVLVSSIIWSKWREGVGYESVAAMSVLVVGTTVLVTMVSRMLLHLKKFEV